MRTVALCVAFACAVMSVHASELYTIFGHRVVYVDEWREAASAAGNVIDAVSTFSMHKYGVTFDHFRVEVRLRHRDVSGVRSRSGLYFCCEFDRGSGVFTARIDYESAAEDRDDASALRVTFMPLVYLDAQTARGPGWLFNRAPEWFIEGLAEFDGRYSSAAGSSESLRASLVNWKARNLGKIDCCGTDSHTLFFPDQATGGAAFLAYLAERFGEDVHSRIVRSGAPTFRRAFDEETASVSTQDLFDGFVLWH